MKTFIAEALNPYRSNETKNDDMELGNKETVSSKFTVESIKNLQVHFEGHNIDCKPHLYATEKDL